MIRFSDRQASLLVVLRVPMDRVGLLYQGPLRMGFLRVNLHYRMDYYRLELRLLQKSRPQVGRSLVGHRLKRGRK